MIDRATIGLHPKNADALTRIPVRFRCHSRAGGNPGFSKFRQERIWMPASAGMTNPHVA